MSTVLIQKRPPTFEPGRPYAWLGGQPDRCEPAAIPVTFLAYDPCPAFVIVQTRAGERQRCLREQLYSILEVK
jgi:hypothetical protein